MIEETLLKNLLKLGESETLEIKQTSLKQGIAKTLCSFLNGKGGKIILGISDNGDVVGVKHAQQTIKALEVYLSRSIIPDVPSSFSILSIDGKECIICSVWAGSRKPYIFDGSIYYRRGSSTQKASSQEISELIHGRQLAELHWERQLALGVDYEDLDEDLINTTFEAFVKRHPESFVGENGALEFLNELGLYQNGGFTNACVILYAKNPSKFLPQARVRLTEYASSKTDDDYIRDEVLEGNFFEVVKTLTNYLNQTGIKSSFSKENWEREDYTIPSDALREGILNALIHRNYENHSSSVSIGIYPNRVVISNTGNLPDGMKVKDLKKSHSSQPNNPNIAHIAFLHGLIEKLGRGTIKIIEECKSAGLKPPIWKDTATDVVLTFNGPQLPKSKSLTSRQLSILRLFAEHGQMPAVGLISRLNVDVSSRTIRTELKSLVERKLLATEGKARNLTYFVTQLGKSELI